MPARARLQALKLLVLAGLLSWLVAGLSRDRGSSPPAPSPAPSPTRPTLTELANRFKSDKGTSFQAGHDYARIY